MRRFGICLLAMSDFADDYAEECYLAGTNPYQYGMLSGSASGSKLLSLWEGLVYKFMDRYLFTGTLRVGWFFKVRTRLSVGYFPLCCGMDCF